MARQLLMRSMGFRPIGAFVQRQSFPHKEAVIDGYLAIVDPRPGRTYVKAERGQGHAYSWPPVGRGRGESLCSLRRIEAKERAYQAFVLWSDGATWEAVARELGYADKSGAWRAVRRMFDRQDYDRWLRDQEAKYQ